jgi:transcription elongation factor SPT5
LFFTVVFLELPGVKPTLSELEKFEESPEGIDIDVAANKDEGPGHTFSAGDNVEVCSGELINLQGKIMSIDGNIIIVMPKHEELHVSHLFFF